MAKDNRTLGVLSMWEAIARCRQAEIGDDDLGFFSSVAEAVWWMTMLDEALWPTVVDGLAYDRHREPRDAGNALHGLRYAWNRQVHDVDLTGMQGNPLLKIHAEGQGSRRGVWRELGDPNIPQGYEPKEGDWGQLQLEVYARVLSNSAVVESLQRSALFLEEYITKLSQQD